MGAGENRPSSPHDGTISDYLDTLFGDDHSLPTRQRRHALGLALVNELKALGEGESFLVREASGAAAIALVGSEAGLAIVTLDDEQNKITTRELGHLKEPVFVRTVPAGEASFDATCLLAIEHPLLPSEKIVHEAGNTERLRHAVEAFEQAVRR